MSLADVIGKTPQHWIDAATIPPDVVAGFPSYSDSLASGVIDAAERFADGQIGRRRLRTIWNEYSNQKARYRYSPDYARGAVVNLIMNYCLKHRPRPWANDDAVSAVVEANRDWWRFWQRIIARNVERRAQCELLRDIVGNPFRSITMDPEWLTPALIQHAQAIYHDRAFDRLPILAYALEEAGCDDPAMLNHLRATGPHCRGCWVLDLALWK